MNDKNINRCLIILLLITGCQKAKTKVENIQSVPFIAVDDPHSYSSPEEARVKHLHLELDVNFDKQELTGKAIWSIDVSSESKEIIFDTDALVIDKITKGANDTPVAFVLKDADSILGSALHIPVESFDSIVTIYYRTTSESNALQWLEPTQTGDGKHRFLFTQSQAILARSWIPVQDSPGIRFSYTATVHVPAGYFALMSARNPQQTNSEGVYEFEQPHPIPAYLMALAVGVLGFDAVGDRCGVYAEPGLLEAARYELAEMQQMLEATESLFGPYAWERYDVLVLPPSFPFGGMENPMLTFATPTILAGDRSLTALIAHELAHSWSGNLVTNANWNDFWLNEGFTVYVERRIMEALYGKPYADMLAVLGYQDLINTIDELTASGDTADAALVISLEGRNPDDGVTDVAYEKGAFLLSTIESITGRDRFDAFLSSYFSEHAFTSVTTQQFVEYLYNNLLEKGSAEDQKLHLNVWLYTSRIPDIFLVPFSTRFEQTETEALAFLNGKSAANLKTKDWSSHEWQYFLRRIADSVSYAKHQELDRVYNLSKSNNAEIAVLFYKTSIRLGYKSCFPQIEIFLSKVGRRKFLTPLYQSLLNNKETEEWGRHIYARNRSRYHSVSRNTLDALMNK